MVDAMAGLRMFLDPSLCLERVVSLRMAEHAPRSPTPIQIQRTTEVPVLARE